MTIRTSLVYLTALCFLTCGGLAQNEPPQAHIVSLTLDPQSVTVLHLHPGFVSSVRLPEEVSSVVLGDPVAFKGEHPEAEPRLVFFKPAHAKPARSNALITMRSGREVSLTLVSDGAFVHSDPVDYVLEYQPERSFLISSAYQESITVMRAAPALRLIARLVTFDEAGGERLLGEYTFNHTRSLPGPGAQ